MLQRTKDIVRSKFIPAAGKIIPELSASLREFMETEDIKERADNTTVHLLADPCVPDVLKDAILKIVLFVSSFRVQFSVQAAPCFAALMKTYTQWKESEYKNISIKGELIEAAHRFMPVLKEETRRESLRYADICMSELAAFIVHASRLGYRMDKDDLAVLRKAHALRDAIKQNTPEVYAQSVELDALTQDIADKMIEKAAATMKVDINLPQPGSTATSSR